MRVTRSAAAVLILLTCIPVAVAQTDPYARIKELESAVEARTASTQDQHELARLYLQSGRFYEARKAAERLLTINGEDVDARRIRNEAVEKLREGAEQKVADAERTAAADPSDANVLALANAYFDAGRYAEASTAYRRLPESMRTGDTLARHARSLAWSRQMDEAERIYAQLVRDQPSAELDLEYGRLLSWMGASRTAIQRLERSYGTSRSEEAVIALANAYGWAGERDTAIRILRDHTAAHPDSREAAALLQQFSTSPALRLERLDKLVALEPYNLALRVNRARLLYEMGEYAEARRTIRFVREHSPDSTADLDELSRMLDERRAEELARLGEMWSSLDRDAPDEVLSLAKGYSAAEEYDRSLELYEHYLDLRPDDDEVRIQYARVLSWDRRYNAAERQYEMLLDRLPERADLRLEYAQALTYDTDYVPAVRTFRSLTDLSTHPRAYLYETVPSRAHFNLGQIYRWFGWNDTAVRQQNAALMLEPGYDQAYLELDRLRHLRPASSLEGRYTFFTDSNDLTARRLDLEGQKWLSNRLGVTAAIGRHSFEREDLDQQVDATALSGGVRYRFNDRGLARARVGFNMYDAEFGDLGTRPFWGLGVEWLPNIQSRTALDYNRYDLIYDVFTLSSLGAPGTTNPTIDPIHIDDFRAHYDHSTGGHWLWLLDASYGFISDDNRRAGVHGLLTWRLRSSPFIALKADGRYLSYDFRTNRYWSPTDYRSIAGIVQIGQNLPKFEWSAEFKLGRSYERDRSSDVRAWGVNVAVPITDAVDIVGDYGYGRSGRFDSLTGTSDPDFVNYWRRSWFVGLRVKQLFAGSDRNGRDPDNPYYFDNRVLTTSPIVPPVGEID